MTDLIGKGDREGAARRISPLLFAWIATVVVFGGIAVWSELTHEPDSAGRKDDAPLADPASVDRAEASDDGLDQATGASPARTGPGGGEIGSAEQSAADVDRSRQADQDDQPDNGGEIDAGASRERSGTPVHPAGALPGGALHPAPDAALVEDGPEGPLPIVSQDGREPWQVYARPFAADPNRPRIAIILTGVGLSEQMTEAAIEALPGPVTFAFSPYAASLQERVNAARRDGHEALLMVPMEPLNYPENDPGPLTLLVDAPDRANLDRLYRVLGRFSGYVGVVNHMGSRFTASRNAMNPVIADLARRGLMIVDARSTRFTVAARLGQEAGAPVAYNNRYIDNDASAVEVRRQLQELKNVAETVGSAVGIGRPYPVTLREVARWAAGLDDDGFVLAPITAIANRQPER